MSEDKNIFSIRKKNTRTVLESYRTKKAFADAVGISPAQCSHVFHADDQYNIGAAMARKIEKAINKPSGWLDIDHDAQPDPLIDISMAVDAVVTLNGVLKSNGIASDSVLPEVYHQMLTDVIMDASRLKQVSVAQVQGALLTSQLSKVTH